MSTVESLKDAGRVTWKWIKRLILLTILVFISYFLFLIFANYSEGTRTGFVTKISKRGYVFKTFEGELNYGFFSGTANTGKPADNVWYFSVTNSRVAYEVVEKLLCSTIKNIRLCFLEAIQNIWYTRLKMLKLLRIHQSKIE